MRLLILLLMLLPALCCAPGMTASAQDAPLLPAFPEEETLPAKLPQWQDIPEAQEDTPAAPTGAQPLVPRDRTRVAVLGYHNFSETKPVTDMLMRTSDFRKQMEEIRNSGYKVISMQEFLEWRFGARQLPEKCILITMDDGWKSVYTDAYPILKEFGYPFHLFLYTQYLSGRGDSMSPAQIREMMANGASIGSHSTGHLYPRSWKTAEAKGEEEYNKLIDREIGQSLTKLASLFGPINTYCYPGGYNTQAMVDKLPGYGYVAAFTVIPGKVTEAENPWLIHRYMVFGNDPSIFRNAMDFRVAEQGRSISTGTTPGTLSAATPPPPFPVFPKPNSTVSCEIPAISANLGGEAGVDFSTLHMKVSGFGRVPAKVDATKRTIEWAPPCRIYMPNISVHVTWTSTDGAARKAEWSFRVDRNMPGQQ